MKFKIFKFKKVKSTNITAIRIAKNSNYKYGMVISDIQTMGRGQYGKKWISYKGNLVVSFFYELENINLSISQLTKINNYLTTNLEELTNKTFNKVDIENKLKLIFEKNLSKMYKLDNKLDK